LDLVYHLAHLLAALSVILYHLFFQSVGPNTAWSLAPTIPFLLFALFQAKFAIITPALITGAFAERIRFWAYMLFMVLLFY
jgi:Amt family ammonium transporter